jgi:putative ABC transport system permease protein
MMLARYVVAQLRGRGACTAALLGGIVIACASLGVLVSTARTQNVQVHGTLGRSFRSSYDILVRPTGSQTPMERREGLVRDNFLSGIFGGITMNQYRQSTERLTLACAGASRRVGRRGIGVGPVVRGTR